MTNQEKVELSVKWFNTLNDEQKSEAVKHLFECAIESEWINVLSEEHAKEASEETGTPIEYYRTPYLSSCGDLLVEFTS